MTSKRCLFESHHPLPPRYSSPFKFPCLKITLSLLTLKGVVRKSDWTLILFTCENRILMLVRIFTLGYVVSSSGRLTGQSFSWPWCFSCAIDVFLDCGHCGTANEIHYFCCNKNESQSHDHPLGKSLKPSTLIEIMLWSQTCWISKQPLPPARSTTLASDSDSLCVSLVSEGNS